MKFGLSRKSLWHSKCKTQNQIKSKKLPLSEEKKSKSNFGNSLMSGNARVMYPGTMEECVSSLWTKKGSKIYTGFEGTMNRLTSLSMLSVFSQLFRSGEGLLTWMCALKNRVWWSSWLGMCPEGKQDGSLCFQFNVLCLFKFSVSLYQVLRNRLKKTENADMCRKEMMWNGKSGNWNGF